MKRIIFCTDGTWDDPQNETNVYKLFKAALTNSGQVPYYDDGVGCDGTPLQKLSGGAFGNGLFQKIKDGYTKIAHVYDQDDQIFVFGFSRGAYTARCLAGMIAICGLPTGPVDPNVTEDAFNAYRDPTLRAAFAAKYNLYNAKITMVGVWDTVGALGLPAIDGGIDEKQYGFLDTNLHPDVVNACHALSIDERRREFPATLWTPPNPPLPGQNLEQIWFSGVHCDVGGGYPETDLSNITFGWMMGKASALGVQFDPDVLQQYTGLDPTNLDATNPLGQIHESWSPLWLFPKSRTIDATSNLGNSVVIRCEYEGNYTPENLKYSGDVPQNAYTIIPVVTSPPAN